MPRIQLVTPNWSDSSSFLPTDTLRPPKAFPIEWAYISEIATLKGWECDVIDAYRCSLRLNDVINRIHTYVPDFVVLSTTPSALFWRCPPLSLKLVRRYTRAIRKRVGRHPALILVGPHGTVDPCGAYEDTGVDFVFRGEFEERLLDELSLLRSHGLKACHHVYAPGQLNTTVAPEISLAGLPATHVNESWLVGAEPHTWLKECREELGEYVGKSVLIETGRGCVFDCGFCLRADFRKSSRLKSYNQMQREIEILSARGVKYVFFIDETFGIPWPHYDKVTELLFRAGIKFGMQTRPDIWTEAKAATLGKRGCMYAEIGTEALEEDNIKRLKKFKSVVRVLEGEAALRLHIKWIGRNILDVTNPDLHHVIKIGHSQKDNEGDPPPPFIPYPGTQWGDSVLESYGLEKSWRSAEAIYILYRLANLSRALHRAVFVSRKARGVLIRLIRLARRLDLTPRWGRVSSTRFERRY